MNVVMTIDHRSALNPVRDQGPRPTCLSFATTTAHEHARGSRVPLSPEYLNYFASATLSSSGVLFGDIARALEDLGQPTEVDCPYHPKGLPLGWQTPSAAALYRRSSQARTPSADQVAATMTMGGLPVLGIALPQPFYTPTSPWVIERDGPVRGRHAVVAVGLGQNSSKRYFLIRNSWGSSWGDAGHAWVDDAFLARHLKDVLTLAGEVR